MRSFQGVMRVICIGALLWTVWISVACSQIYIPGPTPTSIPVLPSYTFATLPNPCIANMLVNVSDNIRGTWRCVNTTHWISVSGQASWLDFGADPTGIADSTAAIQASITAASLNPGKESHCTGGTFLVTDTLIIPELTGISGIGGRSGCQVNFAPAIAKTALQFGTASGVLLQGFFLRDIKIVLLTPNSTGLYMYAAAYGDFRNVTIESNPNQGMTCLVIDGSNISAFGNYFSNIKGNHCHKGVRFLTTGTTVPTVQTFINLHLVGDKASGDLTGVAIEHDTNAGEDTIFIGGNIEGWATGIQHNGQVRFVQHHGLRFESNTTDINLHVNSAQNSFVGAIFRGTVTDPGHNFYFGTTNVSHATYLTGLLNLADSNAGQIQFPTTQNPSAGVNVFDYYKEGTYVATVGGCTTAPTGTVKYTIVGNTVTQELPTISCTSNNTAFWIDGGPVEVRPSASKFVLVRTVNNGGAANIALGMIDNAGSITFSNGLDYGALYTNSGTKQLQAISVSYTLQ